MSGKRRIFFSLLASTSLLLSACNKSDDTVLEDTSEEQMQTEESSQTDDTEVDTRPDDSDNSSEGSLPEGFPSEEFPIMKGAVIENSTLHDDGDITLVFSVEKDLEEVQSFYVSVMESATDVSSEDDDYFIKGKKSGWETEIMISSDSSDTGSSVVKMSLEKK